MIAIGIIIILLLIYLIYVVRGLNSNFVKAAEYFIKIGLK